MKTAEQLMKKKGVFKAEMDQMMPKEQSDLLWKKAAEKLQSIMDQYGELPSGVRSHTNKIFPAAAIYLTVKESCREATAFKIIEDGAIKGCAAIHSKVEKLMKLPGTPSFFIKVWDPMTKKMFGASCGFQNVFYPKKKGEYRMDVTACPYFRYLTELGCPELTRIFCENDERIYQNLPGIQFKRTGTIGKGADRCDFFVRKT